MKQAVMYGGGNIGRGFIGATLSQSGYKVTFIDVAEPVVKALQEKEQAQQQFNFAQTALDKVVAKKLQIIDHDSYKMFIDNLSTLTTKEKEIFDLYTQGLSTKDIIVQQQISENTLKYHNKNIYSKLGVKSRKELLQYIELMRNTR